MWGAPRLASRPWKALDQTSADVVFIATSTIRTEEVIDVSSRDRTIYFHRDTLHELVSTTTDFANIPARPLLETIFLTSILFNE